MRTRQLAATARLAASGAPRLFRAARAAGASRRDAVDVLVLSGAVLLYAAHRARGQPGRANAVRHFAWQALLAARHGTTVAEAVATAQEAGSVRRRDTRIDLRNNEHGRAYADAHPELGALRLTGAVRDAVAAGLAAWDAGELEESE